MDKCETCYNSRVVVSENGIKRICCLPKKEALQCVLDIKDYCVAMRKDKDNNGKAD